MSAAKLYRIGIGCLFSIGIGSGAETLDLDKATCRIDNIDPRRRCSFQSQLSNYLWTLEKDARINYCPNISRPSQSGCILSKLVKKKKVLPFKCEGLRTQFQRLIAHRFEWSRQLLYYDLMLFKSKRCCV